MPETWQEDMATGVPEIDGDHRRIAAIFDRLCQSLFQSNDREAIIATLSELVEVMCEHISREEELMRRIEYEDGGRHKRDHDDFINMLSTLIVDYQTNSALMANDVIALVKTWKYRHLVRYDKPLAEAASRQSALVMAR